MERVKVYNLIKSSILIQTSGDAVESPNRLVSSNVVDSGVDNKLTEAKAVMYLKACPRCEGDMHSNRDMYGSYKECLQCGHMVDLVKPSKLLSLLVPRSGKKVA